MNEQVPLLQVEGLAIGYRSSEGINWIVKDFSFALWPGEKVALLGPSGIGKSSVALALLGLLPENAVVSGSIYFNGELLDEKSQVSLRGDKIGIVFQQPHAYLNPLMTAKRIVAEVLEVKKGLPRKAAEERARALLLDVGLSEESLDKYPFQLSGGMAQRVAIAQAIALEPMILIGDEVTSSLDADLRKGILDLLVSVLDRLGSAFLFISHDKKAVEYVGCRTIQLGSNNR